MHRRDGQGGPARDLYYLMACMHACMHCHAAIQYFELTVTIIQRALAATVHVIDLTMRILKKPPVQKVLEAVTNSVFPQPTSPILYDRQNG